MDGQDDPDDPRIAMRAMFDQLMPQLQPMLEAAVGARDSYKAAGFSDVSSDAMAAEFYKGMIHKMFGM